MVTNWAFFEGNGTEVMRGWQGTEAEAEAMAQRVANERRVRIEICEDGIEPARILESVAGPTIAETEGDNMGLRERCESLIGAKMIHGWHLDGAGPARFGWSSVHGCKVTFRGRTLFEVAKRLGVE
jgi:hypothetical protein